MSSYKTKQVARFVNSALSLVDGPCKADARAAAEVLLDAFSGTDIRSGLGVLRKRGQRKPILDISSISMSDPLVAIVDRLHTGGIDKKRANKEFKAELLKRKIVVTDKTIHRYMTALEPKAKFARLTSKPLGDMLIEMSMIQANRHVDKK